MRSYRRALIAGTIAIITIAGGITASAIRSPIALAAANAVLPGFNSQTFAANDDGSINVALGFPIKYFGNQYTSASLNNNGNLTFGQSLGTYTPYPLSDQGPAMIAAFFADVDTRVGNTVTYGNGTVDGHQAFGVDWPAVGCYNQVDSVRNTFQLLLINRSDIGAGDFDIEFNYNSIQWDSGQASGGNSQCLNGTAARAGYASGSGATGTYYELPGSGADNAFLDSNAATGLINHSYGSTQPGRYVYQIRNGLPGLTSGAPVNATGLGAGGVAVHNPTCSTAHPVNCASGNFWHSITDFAIPERGGPLSLTRTYNSLLANSNGAFGHGWTWSLGDQLTTSSDGTVTITTGDGSAVTAEPAGGDTYVLPTWANSTLRANSDGTWQFVRHQRTVETFDHEGRLISVADLNGDTTTLTYQGNNLAKIMDAAGRVVGVSTDGDGRIVQLTDPMGRSTQYVYNSAGDLTSATDRLGRVTRFTYDTNHELLTMTDPGGGTLTNTYDASGRVTRQSDPMGRITEFSYSGNNYSALGGTTSVTDPNGNVTTQRYTNGELDAVTRASGTPLAATTSYSYDPATLGVASVTDPRGNVTVNSYDADGNLLSTTDPLNRKTTYTYDTLGDLLSRTTPAGPTTTFRYDAKGNLTGATDPAGHITTYGHDNPAHQGDITSVTNPAGQVTTYGYDTDGNLTSVSTSPSRGVANTTRYAYDRDGEQTCKVSPNAVALGTRCRTRGAFRAAGTTRVTYDRGGEVVASTDAYGNTTRYAYDRNGNRTEVINPAGQITRSAYDADNELVKITRPDSTSLTYTYDADGNQLTQTNGAGKTTGYTYDALDQQITATNPLRQTTRFGYDLNGNRISLTDPAGKVTNYSYDQANQLIKIIYSNGVTPDVSYGYDTDGHRVSMKDGTGTSTYTYDDLGRLSSQTDGAGATVGYSYDNAGEITALTYPNGKTVTQKYDGAGDLVEISDWLGKSFTFRYDHNGNVISQTDPNRISARYRYNLNNQVIAITDTDRGVPLASFGYRRDTLGQVTGSVQAGSPGVVVQKYSYDAVNQVASDSYGQFGYDSADNITKLSNGVTQAFDDAGELIASTGRGARTGKITYTYDAQGNRVGMTSGSGNAITLTYDQANRLTAFGARASYAYDGDGLRASKTVDGSKTAFTWDEASSIAMMLADGADLYVYGPDGLPLEKISGTNPTYLLHDQQGSTRLLVNAAGVLVGSYSYDTYGQMIRHAGPASTTLQFDGQYTDAESGFQYLRARYYDPASGVFLTFDPLAELTAAPYAFAFNAPVNLSDPEGLCGLLCAAAGAVAGAVVGGVVSVGTYAIVNHGDITLQGLAAAGAGGIVGGAITGGCDGATLFVVSVGCGIAGGVAGEATTEFINGDGFNGYDIAEAGVTGGIFGGAGRYLPDIVGSGEHFSPSSEAINDSLNGILPTISNSVVDQLLQPGVVC